MQIRFDDFTSNPIKINNGCPLSMLLYAFYNADLIDIANEKNELSTGFVDDCTFVTIGDTLTKTHLILKTMMERPNRGMEWSSSHNSPFEISKLALMDLPRLNAKPPPTFNEHP